MDWKIENELLTKEFGFNNFVEAVGFVNKILPLAEEMNHHPDVLIHSYKKVKVMLYTHSEKKITEKDHSLAKKIDGIKAG
jgi:4a-hydroxytetrahydrobiopterin dehydratase